MIKEDYDTMVHGDNMIGLCIFKAIIILAYCIMAIVLFYKAGG